MAGRSHLYGIILLTLLVYPIFFPTSLWGQEKSKKRPPASVSVAKVTSGQVAPQNEFIATIFYQEISDTASEVSGLVGVVHFEEGQRVKQKQVLVELGSDILRKRLQATTASFEEILSELEIARIDLRRRAKLFKKKSISKQSFDENKFRVIGLEKRAASLKAEIERLEIELEKKIIQAPFDGIVIKRHVDRGEWISEGDTVAIIGKDDTIDIVAEIPERFIQYIKTGMQINATANGSNFVGTVIAIVPRGDVATRTFPIKIRTPNEHALIEGMSARVILPTGNVAPALMVPRDAVIAKFGQNVVYAVVDAKSDMIPVQIVGYDGLSAGVKSQGLTEDMLVVVDGNERLQNGQAVVFQTPEDK
ncbi:MAG: efflux RND transporter periplasmic adaptor subunit [Desulfobacterales bacterium]|jgi:RND family efflux transporter MFP subunit